MRRNNILILGDLNSDLLFRGKTPEHTYLDPYHCSASQAKSMKTLYATRLINMSILKTFPVNISGDLRKNTQLKS